MARTFTEEHRKALSDKLKSIWTDDKRKEASKKWTKVMRNERSKIMKDIYRKDKIRVQAGLEQLSNYKISRQRFIIFIFDDDIEKWKKNEEGD